MICTNDEEAAEIMSMQRQNGMSKGAWNRYQAMVKLTMIFSVQV